LVRIFHNKNFTFEL